MSLGEFYKQAENIIINDIISYFIDNSHLATLSIFFSKTGDKECAGYYYTG